MFLGVNFIFFSWKAGLLDSALGKGNSEKKCPVDHKKMVRKAE